MQKSTADHAIQIPVTPDFSSLFVNPPIVKAFNKNLGVKIKVSKGDENKIELYSTTASGKRNIGQACNVVNYFNATFADCPDNKWALSLEKVEDIIVEASMNEYLPAVSTTPDPQLTLFTPNIKVVPKDQSQVEAIKALNRNKAYTVLGGDQGSGKTFLAVAHAVHEWKADRFKKLILTRPLVEAGENLGFLPGSQKEKMDPYLRPLYDTLEEVIGINGLQSGLANGSIEITPLAFMRGRTLKNSYIIADEMQNATDAQVKMLAGRIDISSRLAMTGDTKQNDRIDSQCGLGKFITVMEAAENAEIVMLKGNYRHPAVTELNRLYDAWDANQAELTDHPCPAAPLPLSAEEVVRLAAGTFMEISRLQEVRNHPSAWEKLSNG